MCSEVLHVGDKCYFVILSTFLIVSMFFFSSRRRHTRCALVTGVQTCALPIFDGMSVTLIRQAGDSGQLYGSVSVRDLAEAMQAQGVEVDRKQVQIGRASCRERVCQYV